LKDESASVKFFGTVHQLPGPLEDGMLLKVRGVPRLHQLYGFSVNIQAIQPAGEGAIRRAAELLAAKLEAEGLFDESRKRRLPYPPARIGLIASKESAAYTDFIKIVNVRWRGLKIELADVQVQGEAAPEQIAGAIRHFNQLASPPEVLVVTRGGGSAEDLQTFSAESVTRAVAASRVPTLVAIGHERDLSLAELAADRRASTPSNAAEMLVPDRQQVLLALADSKRQLSQALESQIKLAGADLKQDRQELSQSIAQLLKSHRSNLAAQKQLLNVLSPEAVLRRGYAIVRKNRKVVRSRKDIQTGDIVEVQLADAFASASVTEIKDRPKD
jgi:exodeoxyribonuclease VII large subunit